MGSGHLTILSGREGDFCGRSLYMRIEYPLSSFMVLCGMSAYPTSCPHSTHFRRGDYFSLLFRYDEGTALMPVVPSKRLLPFSNNFPFMALDADGYDLPSDW